MINCKETTKLLSEAQDRKRNLAEKITLKVHTSMCAGCRNFGTHMKQLKVFLSHFIDQKDPSEKVTSYPS
jgi:predicted anti-sigma-YlaC factor YlaD